MPDILTPIQKVTWVFDDYGVPIGLMPPNGFKRYFATSLARIAPDQGVQSGGGAIVEANYGEIRAYTGSSEALILADPANGGLFVYDSADTTTADNSSTVIVDTLNRRWKRQSTASTGSVWLNGSGAPSNGTGNNGDYYLNNTNDDIYYKTVGAWSLTSNIKGVAGASSAEAATYTALRAYAGTANVVTLTDKLLGGTFLYDSADSTSADNGGTIIVASNSKRWKRVIQQNHNPRWFGAKFDNSTDDTSAWQATVDACSLAGGGVVAGGSGSSVVLGLNMKSNVSLDLRGCTLTKGTTANAGSYLVLFPGTLSATTSTLSANCALNAASVTVTSAAGFAVGDVVMLMDNTYAYSTFGRNQEMNRIIGISGTTITLANSTLGSYATASTASLTKVTTVENAHILGGKLVNPVGNSGGIVDMRRCYECNVTGPTLVGFYHKPGIDINESAYVKISGCTLRDGQGATPGGTNAWPIACGDSAHHFKITDNHFENYNQVTFTNGARYGSFTKNHCTGFQDSAVNTHGAGSNNILIAENIISGGAQYGIAIGQSTSNATEKHISVLGNTITNIAAAAIAVDASVGKEQQDIMISNNTIRAFGLSVAGQNAIFLGHTVDATVNGNQIDGGTSTNINYGIWFFTSTDIQVTGNRVSNIANGSGYGIQSCTRAHLVGNYAKACAGNTFKGLTNTNCRLVANFADVPGASLDAGCTSVSNNI
jgi:hypothetical protein